jgi:broad specificity phosphatase PhoE
VIFLRHALEDGVDQSPVDVNDCQTQQFLTDSGRAQARSIGQQFRALGIPVGRVMNSQFCRARDTALLAFGDSETLEILTPPGALTPAQREEQPDAIRRLLSTPPATGTNTVLVGHGGVLLPITGVNIDRGEAAIFIPRGAAGYTFVTVLASDEWSALAPSK